ncbi:response regulator [Armatimonas rosea]|uniref:Two-component system alkaline phosphatase synthesis response regulator PhoP/two-component system response regulator VicR n=1 Tax=Armatimonas rosea TaxID=685828 RepID=A0A7W9W8D2_ARMRO|nr:response regulator [Armatimonas rosea]MBB6051467.1 two-component system alkaline phosphatase synthesis response regulator PhoP/two-component system response regulator VicR [Armatimonas rosea]
MTKRILAVDDEDSITRILQVNLERAGYTVDTAASGHEALTCLLQNDYDLLISDVMMPEMDGLELIEHIRQSPELVKLPVILLTARSSENDITRGYIKGTDLYLTKPFDPNELRVWVGRMLTSEKE